MDGSLAVVSQSGQSLSFFDLSSGEKTACVENLVAEPHELCLDKKRNLIYVSHAYHHGNFWVHGESTHQITIIDAPKRKVTGSINISPMRAPHGLHLDFERDVLWASVEENIDEKGGGLIAIDLTTRQIVKKVGSEAKTHWFVMTPDGRKAYACNKTAPFISILDLEHECMVGKISVPASEEPSISLDGRLAYCPTPGTSFSAPPVDPKILVIDTATDQIIQTIPLDLGAQSVHVTAKGMIMVGKYSFEANAASTTPVPKAGRLALYESGSHAFLGEVEIGHCPLTLRSSSDGSIGFVANTMSGTVAVVDLAAMRVLRTLEVDKRRDSVKGYCLGAHGMVYLY